MRLPRPLLAVGILAALAGTRPSAVAAAPPDRPPVTVTVRDAAGAPVPWAAVTLTPTDGQGIGAWTAPAPVMRQHGVLFDPFVLAVRTGAEVAFPNLDDIRHHVYSFSRAKRFELRLYGKDENKLVVFDQPGVVALGCTIHDNMLSFIHVSDAPVQAVTDAQGRAAFAGLPAGAWEIGVWHPDLAGDGPPPLAVRTGPDAAADAVVAIPLRKVRRVQEPPREGRY
ncbi:methylamine utilization protein [bacterium]|nr:methylamine utilization protein [bacterium]